MAKTARSIEKEEFWRLVLSEYGSFDGSVRDYCRREGLSENSFYGWRRELARRDAESSDVARFVPVEIVASDSEPRCDSRQIEILTPGGFRLRFEDTIRKSRLSEVVGVVMELERGASRC